VFVTIELEKDHYAKALEVHMRNDGTIILNLMQGGAEPLHSLTLSAIEEARLRNAVDFLGEFHG
jgi:hypothetical protein